MTITGFYIQFKYLFFFFLVTILFNIKAANAQHLSDSLKVELETIEVNALRNTITDAEAPLSYSINRRNLEQINQEASLSLKSVGDKLPGLWINNRNNYAYGESMSIRGLGWRADYGIRGIQIILDDIPLTVADGQSMSNIIPRSFVRRAELIRGPASSYWGNSSGGVLYLSTTPNTGHGIHGRFRGLTGSYGLFKGEGELSISQEDYDINAYTSYFSTNGYRDYSSAELWRSGLNGKVKLTSRSRLEFQTATTYMPWAGQPSSLSNETASKNPTEARTSFIEAGSGKKMNQEQAGLSYILDTSAGLLDISGFGAHRDLNNPLPFGIITVNRWAGGLRTTLDKDLGWLRIQGGAETKLQFDDRVEYENIGENGQAVRGDATVDQLEQVIEHSLFVHATYPLGSFNIMGSLRYDRITFSTDSLSAEQVGKRSFQSLSPNIGIGYSPSRFTIYTNFNSSFQTPTTTELTNRPKEGNGYNPFLKPERTWGLEAGIRNLKNQAFTFDFALYRLWINDLIFPYQLKVDGATYYRNQGQTVHMGIEAAATYHIRGNLSIDLTANITKATFKQAQTLDSLSLKGKDIPGIPSFRLHSKIDWKPNPFQISLSYEYINSFPVNNENTAYNDHYGVVDLKFSARHLFSQTKRGLQPFININNLFNVRYNGSTALNNPGGRYYEPSPGRHWAAGLSFDF